ncbi:hypothetical protein CALCODRAFT_483785 [Calocera cornea HHB12733]|uniref:Uncharacterized protein n=1 Tax=Calocera cornea HHB12733 TaxID=1353952 RepID=A0A165FEZ5_9BASI|nr:hypothetical protein CALCODRAFT_483785 [Calocera cornea HHB12733]
MALSELGLNQDFASPPFSKATGKRPASCTAGPPTSSRNDIEHLLSSKARFPAQSTPLSSDAHIFATPRFVGAASTASPPRRDGNPVPPPALSPIASANRVAPQEKSRFVPESPHAWSGASMAMYDTLAQLSSTPLLADTLFDSRPAGLPFSDNQSRSAVTDPDAGKMFSSAELDKLINELSPLIPPPQHDANLHYGNFLDDLSLITAANGMTNQASSDYELGGSAGHSATYSQNGDSGWPAGHAADSNDFSAPPPPPMPNRGESSSPSGPHDSPARTPPPSTPKSSSSDARSSSPVNHALVPDEGENMLWEQTLESSFDSEEEGGAELAEMFKKRAQAMCSSYYKDTYGHASGALPPDSRQAIKICRQLTRGFVEFLCEHYNLQQQRVWKEIGAFVGWARSINAWNLFQRKWREDQPAGRECMTPPNRTY